MPTTSSYQALADYLTSKKADFWEASFSDVERKLGRPLPPSAYRHQAWWANQNGPGHSQTHGWRSVGWRTARLDLERKRVRFERESGPQESKEPEVEEARPADDDALFAQAAEYLGTSDRAELIRQALRALLAREAADHLIRMGGGMPDLKLPPRERPLA